MSDKREYKNYFWQLLNSHLYPALSFLEEKIFLIFSQFNFSISIN